MMILKTVQGALLLSLVMMSSIAFGFPSIGNTLNANCPTQPFTGDCSLCHVANRAASTPAKTAAKAGNWDFFCPPQPACTDADQDMFFAEGGSCGPQDCNDNDPAVNPGAAERCSDGIDNNCDGLTDGQDTAACPAPPTPSCTDADADGFFAQSGCNTAVDCSDNDSQVFPGAAELCGDGVDNDCDGMIDENCTTGGNDDGATLYESNCVSCHNALTASEVCGEDTEDIMEAIAKNEGGMGFLSSLTDDQIRAIAEVLSHCSQDTDEDHEEKADEDHDKKKEHKAQDHGSSKHKKAHGHDD